MHAQFSNAKFSHRSHLDQRGYYTYYDPMEKALFPGSFDPPTHGHINVIRRAARIFDEIHVVIAVNRYKHYSFTDEERFEMMKVLTRNLNNVYVHICDSLIVEFAQQLGAKVLLRGVRALADFNYEFELSMVNRSLNNTIETFLMPTDPKYFVLRSSMIRELVSLGGDISAMVPEEIMQQIIEKFSAEAR